MRQERSRPLIYELQAWSREQRANLSRSNDTAKAFNCCLSRWDAFTRFLDDGRLCMSNNAAERELGAVSVGRRNWTFAGSDEGGRSSRQAHPPTPALELAPSEHRSRRLSAIGYPSKAT